VIESLREAVSLYLAMDDPDVVVTPSVASIGLVVPDEGGLQPV
jgi:hypothetical protein